MVAGQGCRIWVSGLGGMLLYTVAEPSDSITAL